MHHTKPIRHLSELQSQLLEEAVSSEGARPEYRFYSDSIFLNTFIASKIE